MIDRAARIGILGAGASGLAAAHALAGAGYRSVCVLDRSDRVGGKCRTFTWQGRSYELGAGALTSAYTHVRALMDEVGVRATAGVGGLFTDLDGARSTFVPPPLRSRSLWTLGGEMLSLARLLRRERDLVRPGLADLPADYHLPFAEWARSHRVEGIAELIEPWFTGFGYGYFDEVPAAYVLKYAALFRFPIYELLDGGYQDLWERVARPLDVRLGVAVRRITRGDTVTVETGAAPLTFDALIIACPLEDVAALLDAGDEERALFARIRYNDYHVVAAEMEGAPTARYGFLHKHLRRDHAGQILFWYRRWKDRDLVLFYALPPAGTPL
jgi:predicted NAD/FAD-dependent oxidoreductase